MDNLFEEEKGRRPKAGESNKRYSTAEKASAIPFYAASRLAQAVVKPYQQKTQHKPALAAFKKAGTARKAAHKAVKHVVHEHKAAKKKHGAKTKGHTKTAVRGNAKPGRNKVGVRSNSDGTQMRVTGHEFLHPVSLTQSTNVVGGIITSGPVHVGALTDSRVQNYARNFESIMYHSWEYRFVPMAGNNANGRFISYTNMDSAETAPSGGQTAVKIAYNHAGCVATNVSDVNSQRMPRMTRKEPMYIAQIDSSAEAKRNTIAGNYYLVCDVPYNYDGLAPAQTVVIGDLMVYYDVTFMQPATDQEVTGYADTYSGAMDVSAVLVPDVEAKIDIGIPWAASDMSSFGEPPATEEALDPRLTSTTLVRPIGYTWSYSNGFKSSPPGVAVFIDEDGILRIRNPANYLVSVVLEGRTVAIAAAGNNSVCVCTPTFNVQPGVVSGNQSCDISAWSNNQTPVFVATTGDDHPYRLGAIISLKARAAEPEMLFTPSLSATWSKHGSTVTSVTMHITSIELTFFPDHDGWLDEDLPKEDAELKQLRLQMDTLRELVSRVVPESKDKDELRTQSATSLARRVHLREHNVSRDAKEPVGEVERKQDHHRRRRENLNSVEFASDSEAEELLDLSVRGPQGAGQVGLQRSAGASRVSPQASDGPESGGLGLVQSRGAQGGAGTGGRLSGAQLSPFEEKPRSRPQSLK